VWDLGKAFAPEPARNFTPQQREKSWQQLGVGNGLEVYRALATLAAEPAEAVKFLDDKWRRLDRVIPASFPKLLADLESPQFATRDRATRALRDLGVLAVPPLAAYAPKNLEASQRGQDILKKIKADEEAGKAAVAPDLLRLLRTVTLLSRINTPQARQSLEAMIRQWPDSWLADEAQKALGKNSKR
jgi:hypothetical protein